MSRIHVAFTSHCTGIDRTLPRTRYSSSSGQPPREKRERFLRVASALRVDLCHDSMHMHLIVLNYYALAKLFKGQFIPHSITSLFKEVEHTPKYFSVWNKHVSVGAYSERKQVILSNPMASWGKQKTQQPESYRIFNEMGLVSNSVAVEQSRLLQQAMSKEDMWAEQQHGEDVQSNQQRKPGVPRRSSRRE